MKQMLLEKKVDTAYFAQPFASDPEVLEKTKVLFTTADISLGDANALLRAEGFHGVMKLDEVRKVEKIPVLGTGKTDYKVLRGWIESGGEAAAGSTKWSRQSTCWYRSLLVLSSLRANWPSILSPTIRPVHSPIVWRRPSRRRMATLLKCWRLFSNHGSSKRRWVPSSRIRCTT